MSPAQVARRWFEEVWERRNIAVVYELMPTHAIGHMAHADFIGPEGFHEAWIAFTAMMPDVQVEVEAIIEQGEHAVIRWRMSGRHTGEGFGLQASMAEITYRGLTWMHCRDGQLVEAWDGWNQGELFAQLQAASAARQAELVNE